MKTKILLITFLAASLIIAGSVSAVQAQQQIQVANQGQDIQIKTQNSEQVQQTVSNTGGAVEQQFQVQQNLESQDVDSNQVQNQNQIKNKGQTNQIQNNEQEGTQQDDSPSDNALQRRSMVANAVQEMLQVADRNGGIGQQVRTIAQSQNQNQEMLEASLQKVQSRSGVVKFLIGPNYGEIKNAQKILEQNREQIQQLNQIRTQLTNQGDQNNLNEQIQTLEQASLEIENSLNNANRGFSLLGWIFKLFSK